MDPGAEGARVADVAGPAPLAPPVDADDGGLRLGVIGFVSTVGLLGLPVGIGVGILRCRLYDIDRIISRTLSYALLTGVLVAVFAGLVLLTTRVLPFSSPVSVAASTLAAVALFNPLQPGSSESSTGASTAPATTARSSSPPSAPGSATQSTPRPSSPSSPPPRPGRCSRPTSPSGFDRPVRNDPGAREA